MKLTQEALLQRIRRALKKDGKSLRKGTPRWYANTGDWYVVNANNFIEDSHIDLHEMALSMHVAFPFELKG